MRGAGLLSLCFDIYIKGVSHHQQQSAASAERENLRTCGGGAVRAQSVCVLSVSVVEWVLGGWLGAWVGGSRTSTTHCFKESARSKSALSNVLHTLNGFKRHSLENPPFLLM